MLEYLLTAGESMAITRVCLAGGLGNQLFQLAAGLDAAGSSPLVLIGHLGGARCDAAGVPDLMGFDLAPNITLQAPPGRRSAQWTRRAANLALRSGVKEAGWDTSLPIRVLAPQVARLALRRDTGTLAPVYAGRGLGYDPRVATSGSGSTLIGYFQSWRYSTRDSMLQALRGGYANRGAAFQDFMRDRAAVEYPLVVHVRLGDYREAVDFGLLGTSYYEAAYEAIRSTGVDGFDSVWLYSDEPEAALELLPRSLAKLGVRVVDPPPVARHPAVVMASMMNGRAYILANSTFGYWAARLSHAPGSSVVIPSPWFANAPAIADLAPPEWLSAPRGSGPVASAASDPEGE